MALIGYARVSSSDQNEARQLESLRKAGCEQIYLDKISGKDFERPAWRKLTRRLRPGDVIFIHSLDRLGRNYELIKEQWQHIVRDRQAHIVVLDMPILDTRQGQGLIGRFISDIVLQLLAFVAQQERENIRARQAEGIRLAMARGVRFGRREKPLPDGWEEVFEALARGCMKMGRASAELGMNYNTLARRYRIWLDAQKGGIDER